MASYAAAVASQVTSAVTVLLLLSATPVVGVAICPMSAPLAGFWVMSSRDTDGKIGSSVGYWILQGWAAVTILVDAFSQILGSCYRGSVKSGGHIFRPELKIETSLLELV